MTDRRKKLQVALETLPPGFHRRRIEARGIGFDLFIWRGAPGPVLLLNGATHGDEYEGPTLLRGWAENWRPRRLTGCVVAVPVLNERAFRAGQRCDPQDGANLARAFPGRRHGSPTTRLAHLFDTELLAQATHYVDLHSAGSAYELDRWVGYITRDDTIGRTQRGMAACFDAFWCWGSPFLPGRTLSAAHTRNIPAVYVECRGAGGILQRDLRDLDRGLRHLLRRAGILPGPAPRLRAQRIRITDDKDEAHLQIHHPSPHNGIFVPAVSLGSAVRSGQAVGRVLAVPGTKAATILAARSGRVVMLRYQRSVCRGDALVTLAPV